MAISRQAGSGMLRMALARHAAAGPVVSASTSSQRLLSSTQMQSIRAMSTSRILRLATPVTGPTQIQSQPNPQGALNDVSTFTKQSAEKVHSSYPEELTSYPDYSKGPSALDKASQLFFFTEILRGELNI
jgi:NADH dehydrogenase (ubiquinone) Fe-S protein 8